MSSEGVYPESEGSRPCFYSLPHLFQIALDDHGFNILYRTTQEGRPQAALRLFVPFCLRFLKARLREAVFCVGRLNFLSSHVPFTSMPHPCNTKSATSLGSPDPAKRLIVRGDCMTLKKAASKALHGLRLGLTSLALFQFAIGAPIVQAQDHDGGKHGDTKSPIKHVFVLI